MTKIINEIPAERILTEKEDPLALNMGEGSEKENSWIFPNPLTGSGHG